MYLYMQAYVSVWVYMHLEIVGHWHMPLCLYACMSGCLYVRLLVFVCLFVRLFVCLCACMFVQICVFIYDCVFVYIHLHMIYIYVYIRIYTYIYIHTQNKYIYIYTMYIYIYTYVYIYIYVYMHSQIQKKTFLYTRSNVCLHVFAHICRFIFSFLSLHWMQQLLLLSLRSNLLKLALALSRMDWKRTHPRVTKSNNVMVSLCLNFHSSLACHGRACLLTFRRTQSTQPTISLPTFCKEAADGQGRNTL